MTNHTTPDPTNQQRPLQIFIEEMGKLQINNTHPELQNLRTCLDSAYESLLLLRQAADELPDLSTGGWFLRSQFICARSETLDKLRITKNALSRLSFKAREEGDPYGIMPFVAGFMNFVESVTKSPVVFQQPYEPRFFLRVPEPLPPPSDEFSLDSLLGSDFSGPQ